MDELIFEQRMEIEDSEKPMLAYFQPSVLAQYRTEGHKYSVELTDFEGEVGLNPEYSGSLDDAQRSLEGINLKFGFRKLKSGDYCLAVFKYQFGQYSRGHIDRWLPHLIDSDQLAPLPDLRFERWAARYLYGSWEVENNVIQQIELLISEVNAITLEFNDTQLFQFSGNPHLHMPLAENDHAYQDSQKELYSLTIDGLNSETIDAIATSSGVTLNGSATKTRQRLERCLPNISTSSLWKSLSNMSSQRRKATHKVRPRAKKFDAFEAFDKNLQELKEGLVELKVELQNLLGINAEKAVDRREALRHIQTIDRPMVNSFGVAHMNRIIGRTVARVESGLRENFEEAHSSDVILIHFTDGSVLGLDTGTNACNVSSSHGDFPPSEFDVYFIAKYVPPPARQSKS